VLNNTAVVVEAAVLAPKSSQDRKPATLTVAAVLSALAEMRSGELGKNRQKPFSYGGVPFLWTHGPLMPMPSAFTPSTGSGLKWTGRAERPISSVSDQSTELNVESPGTEVHSQTN
jgi:hypothetical protein